MKTLSSDVIKMAKKFHVQINAIEVGIFDKRVVWEVFSLSKPNVREITMTQNNKEVEAAIKIVAEKTGHAIIDRAGRFVPNPTISKEVHEYLESLRKEK